MNIQSFEQQANLETIRQFYPKTAESIDLTWGYKECCDYITDLSSKASKEYFPKEVCKAVKNLASIHQVEF